MNSGPPSVWKRWTPESDVPFHRYCGFVPRLRDGDYALRPNEAATDPPILEYCPPIARTALYYTPLIVILAGLASIVKALVEADSLSVEVPNRAFVVLLTLILLILIILWIFISLLREVHDVRLVDVSRPIAVYGTIGILLMWTSYSVYAAIEAGVLGVIFGSQDDIAFTMNHSPDLLLLLFVGGYLVYDGMLKTENLFSNLHEKDPSVLSPTADGVPFREYRSFTRERFSGRFQKTSQLLEKRAYTSQLSVRTAYVFAFLFVLLFALGSTIQVAFTQGSMGGSFGEVLLGPLAQLFASGVAGAIGMVWNGLSYGLVFVALVVLVVVFYQFLILIDLLNTLLSDHGPDVKSVPDGFDFKLRYDPTHPDGYAGFRDFGSFATRVNTLLIIGGVYGFVRLLLHGIPRYTAIEGNSLVVAVWAVDYLGPLVLYFFSVFAWFYLSFWQLHKAMKRGRERRLRELLERVDPEDSPELFALERRAPVWPINANLLVSIASIDLLPILLPFLLIQS